MAQLQAKQLQPGTNKAIPEHGTFCAYEWLLLLLTAVCVLLAAADLARGSCKHALGVVNIEPLMKELLNAAAQPMLTDVKLTGINADRLHPPRIPDLCIGRPVVVSGEAVRPCPEVVSLQGKLTGELGRLCAICLMLLGAY